MQVIVDGTPIAYTDEGSGPVLVFVHGWRDAKETWHQLISPLKASYRCVAIDLPNFGSSSPNPKITSLQAYARTIAAFLKKLEIDQYDFIGHSMGGQIGVYGVGSDILSPVHLVLVAAAGIRDESLVQKKVLRGLSKPLRRLLPGTVKSSFYKKIGSDYDPSLSPVLKETIANVLDTDVQIFASKIKIPTLLIYGELDRSTPPRFGKKLHELIKGSQYDEVRGQDHWLHQQAVREVSKRIVEFL